MSIYSNNVNNDNTSVSKINLVNQINYDTLPMDVHWSIDVDDINPKIRLLFYMKRNPVKQNFYINYNSQTFDIVLVHKMIRNFISINLKTS